MTTDTTTVESWYYGISTRDWDLLRSITACDIDFHVAQGFPAGGHYRGQAEVFDVFFPTAFASWSEFITEMDEVIDAGDVIVVRGRYVGTAAISAVDFEVPFAHIWRLENGLLCWLQQYTDTALLRAAIEGVRTGL